MNTANALGYLLGALVFPLCSRRWPAGTCFVAGCVVTALVMAVSGMISDTARCLHSASRPGSAVRSSSSAGACWRRGWLPRILAMPDSCSACTMAARVGHRVSALLVPFSIGAACTAGSGRGCAGGGLCVAFGGRDCRCAADRTWRRTDFRRAQKPRDPLRPPCSDVAALRLCARRVLLLWRRVYRLHDVHHRVLRNGGMSASVVTAFYVALGLATVVSARLWSGLLNRMRGGQALAVLNGLLAFATVMPVLVNSTLVAFVSGVLFGATFLSAVASTTAFVRHNFPPLRWAQGISAFTIVFAFGQIVGPMSSAISPMARALDADCSILPSCSLRDRHSQHFRSPCAHRPARPARFSATALLHTRHDWLAPGRKALIARVRGKPDTTNSPSLASNSEIFRSCELLLLAPANAISSRSN